MNQAVLEPQTGRQTDRQTDKQTNRQTHIQTGRQTYRQTDVCVLTWVENSEWRVNERVRVADWTQRPVTWRDVIDRYTGVLCARHKLSLFHVSMFTAHNDHTDRQTDRQTDKLSLFHVSMFTAHNDHTVHSQQQQQCSRRSVCLSK